MKRLCPILAVVVVSLAAAGLVLAQADPLKTAGTIPGARIFDHYVGRAIRTASGTVAFGYFTFLEGIPGPFFAGTPHSEATAFFTFRTDPLVFSDISRNGSILFATLRAPTYQIYFNPSPHGDWSKPDSFSSGELIATFKRTDGFFTCNGNLNLLNTCSSFISGKLASSADFTFHGREFNLKTLVPFGITDISPMIDSSFPGFAAVFAGYEVAIGETKDNDQDDEAP